MKKYIYTFLISGALIFACAFGLRAQERPTFNNLELHAGYGYLTNGARGLTSQTNDYVDKLSSGLSWDASYHIRLPLRYSDAKVRVGFGAKYAGYHASGEREYSSDKLFLHSWFLDCAVYYIISGQMEIRGNIGAGMLYYVNNSTVYGKRRYVTGDEPAFNLGLGYYYFLPSGLGFSAKFDYIYADMNKLYSDYHGEVIKVKYDEDDVPLGQISLSIGVAYRF